MNSQMHLPVLNNVLGGLQDVHPRAPALLHIAQDESQPYPQTVRFKENRFYFGSRCLRNIGQGAL